MDDRISSRAWSALPGGPTRAILMNGSRLKGHYVSLRDLSGEVCLRMADGEQTEIAPAQIRWLAFQDPLASQLESTKAVDFRVVFGDGRRLEGRCDRMESHPWGAAARGLHTAGTSVTLYFPWCNVQSVKVGKSGTPLKPPLSVPEAPAESTESEQAQFEIEPVSIRTRKRDGVTRLRVNLSELAPAQIAEQLGLPYMGTEDLRIPEELVDEIPGELAHAYRLAPVGRHDGHLQVAMANPLDNEARQLLQFLTGAPIEVIVADPVDINALINRVYSASIDTVSLEELMVESSDDKASQNEEQELTKLSAQRPIVRLVQAIFVDAMRRSASDIHIRPGNREVELIYRIDGELIPVRTFAKQLLRAVVSRIKIIGGMDITERRVPQDGQARLRDGNRVVDLRLSIIPTIEGESVVVRLLNPTLNLSSVADLEMADKDSLSLRNELNRSSGMILVTGPTGSGKSTTLYAALHEIIKRNVNIITIENPVEYHIQGIEQINVNPDVGLTFARALRNILRHDPDVVMVGEVRDEETCRIAVESALTGHLVLTTLHTNSAAMTLTRLLEMNVPSYLLRATVQVILAQRLVRLNCRHCLGPEKPGDEILDALQAPADGDYRIGRGCHHCNDTGVTGRRMVYEMINMDDRLRELLTDDIEADDLQRAAVEQGMRTLNEHALELARSGVISLSEAYRVRIG